MGATGCSVGLIKNNRGTKRGHNFRYNLIVLAMIVMLVSVPLIAAPPVLAAPAVGISVSSGAPGSTVVISGTDFVVGDSYSIVFGPATAYEQTLFTSTIITSGTTFGQTVTIPLAPWAQFTIRVDTNKGNFSLSFQVTPHIDLSNTTGHAGDTVIVSGAGFRAGTAVNILFGNTSVASVTSDTSGSLPSFSFLVPSMRSGSYAVYGTDTLAISPSVFYVLLTRLSASILESKAGDHVTLTGSGFEYNSPLTFYWDGQTVSSIQISSSGTGVFTADFVVPSAARGTHSIKVVDNSARQANVIFVVNPSLILNPTNSKPGNVITATGRGFRANVTITITFSGNTLATQPTIIITDGNGAFSGTFTVPSVIAGSYTVRASDDANAVTTTLGIISIIELTPASGSVGTALQVTGTGFSPSSSVALSYDAQQITTVNTDASGSFTASFKVPASKAGAHVISAKDLATTVLVTTATFTMESVPPPKPNLLAPESSSQAGVSPKFVWSEVSDPSGVAYNLQVAWDAAFASLVLTKQGLTAPGYEVTQAEMFGLTKNTTPYYWRVKAIDGAGNEGEWTSPANFYTQDSTPPPLPLLLSPQNDSQAPVRPALKWSDAVDPSGVTYSLQVATDIGFTHLVIYKQGLNVSNYQTAQTEQLELTKKLSPYYWRVKTIDGVGNESAWTSPITFYTQDSTPPPAPVSLKPEQGSKQGSETFFSWLVSEDISGVTYTLQVSQDAIFSQVVVVKEGLQTAQYKLSKQEKLNSSSGNTAGAYYWRVKAIDGAGNESGWSNTNEFKVKSFLQSGWPVYTAIGIGGLLLLALGIFIGMHIRQKGPDIT
jgi:hypothetical protein